MKTKPIHLLLILLVIGTSCKHQGLSEHARPNIVCLIAEDISPALGCYGDPLARTPRIDALAAGGLVYDFALTTAPICAPSRSTLMSGLYATSLGTQHLRCEIPFPLDLRTLPELLAEAGYFTSNRDKSDYNFDPEGRWEHWSSSLAPWRFREEGQPFYSFINVGPSHEGSVNSLGKYQEFTRDMNPEDKHDPGQVNLPPYYPDSPQTRKIWAHYYDILSLLDKHVGLVLDSLEADGLLEETFVFFIADHGFGMPRFKRWLNISGMHVPLVVHVPENYRELVPGFEGGTRRKELVSFIDLVPTFLNLAGTALPPSLEGRPFMGKGQLEQRKLAFGARDRADDMFEMSRSVCDGRYMYIRHYMPHLPYIQEGYIYSDEKEAYRELRRLYREGECNELQASLWHPKPVEELYDLASDPLEEVNLAGDPAYARVKAELRTEMHAWMIAHRDLGLLPEAEYMRRAGEQSPYAYARHSGHYQVEALLEAAERVGMAGEEELLPHLDDPDSGVRYWTLMGLRQAEALSASGLMAVGKLLKDQAPSVQVAAADVLCHLGPSQEAIETLGTLVLDPEPRVALEAARCILLAGEAARPLIPVLYQALENFRGDGSKHRKYADFNYAAFTSWSLEWALAELGEEIQIN